MLIGPGSLRLSDSYAERHNVSCAVVKEAWHKLIRNLSKLMCRFHIVGGECNYLLRVNDSYSLEFVDDKDWMSAMMLCWTKDNVKKLLDEAEMVLLSTAQHLRLPVRVRFL